MKLHISDISPRCILPQRTLSTQRLFKTFFLSVLSDLSGEHLCFFFDQTDGSTIGDWLEQRTAECRRIEPLRSVF